MGVGNGFDIAHRLPTKYSDFLEFVSIFKELYSEKYIGNHIDMRFFNYIK